MMPRLTWSLVALALALPRPSVATEAPQIMKARDGLLAVPFIPGGAVVAACTFSVPEVLGYLGPALVVEDDDGGTWRLDLVANERFDVSTLRVTQLEGDTAGTQRLTIQDGKQLRWAEFVEPCDMITGASDIPSRISAGVWYDSLSLELTYTLRSLDGELVTLDNAGASPEDWLIECDERAALADAALTLLELAEFE